MTKFQKKAINLVFPHQLFYESTLLDNDNDFYLIEENLFFKQYKFHKQKIVFHRATMKCYQSFLESKGKKVHYIDSTNMFSDIRKLNLLLEENKIDTVFTIDPTDFLLEKRLHLAAKNVELLISENPQFLNSKADLAKFFRADKKSFFQTSFYKEQRKKHNILLDKKQEPLGGKWTFDGENRNKYPKNQLPPSVLYPKKDAFWDEAIEYTQNNFGNNLGFLPNQKLYPTTQVEAEEWLDQFLEKRFHDFGAYEDAMVKDEFLLNHSLLSPLMNSGLLLPNFVLKKTLDFAEKESIPLNSTEGFIRQIIGWREFIRGMYTYKGSFSRTRNFWDFKRKIPKSFYDGSTGIIPIDKTIKKVLKTGYCHHIERLMVLGNFMLLCEFDPDEVYIWFMELFVDAYDWVMVPNVYGMCLFADGGTFATKPYISGSAYIKKMSDFEKGEWESIWDGLFWRFIIKHQDFFIKNPRTSMMVYSLNKMPDEKKQKHQDNANLFLNSL